MIAVLDQGGFIGARFRMIVAAGRGWIIAAAVLAGLEG